MAINEFPIETTPAEAYILQVLADNGFESGGGALANVGAIATKTLASDAVVPAQGRLEITPENFTVNDFGGLLDIDGGLLKTANAERMNLIIRTSLPLSVLQDDPFEVYIERETGSGVERVDATLTRVRGQLFKEVSEAVVLATYTSGPSDNYNIYGFSIIFENPSNFGVTIKSGEIRTDIFAVADTSSTQAGAATLSAATTSSTSTDDTEEQTKTLETAKW